MGEFVDEVAGRDGTRPALEDGPDRYTAAEVARWVHAFAAAVGAVSAPGDRVALLANRDGPTLLALMGISAAGRVVVPIDPREPEERVAAILRSARPRVCIRVTGPGDGPWVLCSADLGDADVPFPRVDPDAPTLLLFTSGSTGKPKGLLRTHAMVTTQGVHLIGEFGFYPGLRIAYAYPLSFLGGAQGFFATLGAGAEYCLVDPSVVSPGSLAVELARRHLEGFSTVPSHLRAVADHALRNQLDLTHVRRVMFGGEPVNGAELARVRAAMPQAWLINGYGTQEAGTVARWDATDDDSEGPLPAGLPLPDCTLFVVDERAVPCSPGTVGEVLTAGPYVAVEYWDDPAATATCQVVVDGVLAMRTGDLGRWRADGALEIVGRTDHRVKVWGQGVDLLQVEAELGQLPGVAAAVVSPVPDARAGVRLVAHVQPVFEADVDPAALRRALREALPGYMVPGTIRVIDAMPLTVREKVDRAALDEAAATMTPGVATDAPPHTAREAEIRAMAAEVLELPVEQIGTDDDFFALGGDSLRAVELFDAITERYRVGDTELASLAQAMTREPTISGFARALTLGLDAAVVTDGGAALVRVGPSLAHASQRCFFVPAAVARLVGPRPLAERLERTELFTFIPRGLNSPRWPDRTMSACVRRQVALLRSIQTSGPYVLAGHSFGGLVAVEMARTLQEAGEAVALVILFDTPLHPQVPPSRLGHAYMVARARASEFVVALDRSPTRRATALRFVCAGIGLSHDVAPYEGRVLLLRAQERDDALADLGWGEVITGHLEVQEVPGGHNDLLSPPHIEVTAPLFEFAVTEALREAAS